MLKWIIFYIFVIIVLISFYLLIDTFIKYYNYDDKNKYINSIPDYDGEELVIDFDYDTTEN